MSRELEAKQLIRCHSLQESNINEEKSQRNIVFHAEKKRNELQNNRHQRGPCMIEKEHIIFLKTKGDRERAHFFRGAN